VRLVSVTAVAVVIICLVGWLLPRPGSVPTPERRHVGYLGSGACRECHATEYEAWKGSAHSKTLQPVSPSTVAGEFTGVGPVSFNQLTSAPVAWEDIISLTDGRQVTGTIVSETAEKVLLRRVDGQKPISREHIKAIDYGAERRQKQEQGRGDPARAEYNLALIETRPGEQDPEVQRYEVSYVLGAAEQTQQYLTRLPDGRLQVLPLVWDAKRKRWYDHRRLLPQPQDVVPGDPQYWRGYENTANLTCLQCHVSQLETNYDDRTDTYHSTWSEPGVNCETCHGPAAEHVATARQAQATGSRPTDWGLKSLATLSAQARTEVCAQCHSLRRAYSPELKPGENYYDHFAPRLWFSGAGQTDSTPGDQNYQHPSLLRKVSFRGRYWPDGTPRDRNYQYLSLLGSRCLRSRDPGSPKEPLTCTDCHNPHANRFTTGPIRSPGTDALCTRCHSDVAADLTAHTHHQAEGPGSRCLNCHMPRVDIPMGRYTVDHRITVPTPRATVAMEIPNACIDCHRSETPEWVARRFTEWYGEDPTGHLARTEVMMALAQGDLNAVGAGLRILTDPKESPPLRATMATALAPTPYASVQRALLKTAFDANPLVQIAALKALSPAWVVEHVDTLARLLRADRLAVRLAAVRKFTVGPELIDRLPPAYRNVLRNVLNEAFEVSLRQREEPGSAVALARIQWIVGRRSEATRQYRLILEKYPNFIPARAALAGVYLAQQRFEEALTQFTALADINPDDLAAQVGAAQCLIPMGRPKQAAGILEAVLQADRTNISAHLHLGLAYQYLGKNKEARAEWEETLRLDPDNVAARALLEALVRQGRP